MLKGQRRTLSPATLYLFQECPRCFWFAIKKGLSRPLPPFPSLPVGLDRVIKEDFQRYREKEILPTVLQNKISGKLAVNMPELLIYQDDSGYALYGRPDDYIQSSDEAITVLEIKTRASPPKAILPINQTQLDIYDYLLYENGYKTTGRGYLVYFYPILKDTLSFETSVSEITANRGTADRLFKNAIKLLGTTVPPERSAECEFCIWHSLLLNESTGTGLMWSDVIEISREIGESQLYEFKAPGTDPRHISKEICAFANTSQGGIVFYGIDDDGLLRGSDISLQELDQRLQNSLHSSADPYPPFLLSEKNSEDGLKIIIIEVRPWNRRDVYSYDGRIYVRKGTNAFPATSSDRERLYHGEPVA